jgi:hypothetical protein
MTGGLAGNRNACYYARHGRALDTGNGNFANYGHGIRLSLRHGRSRGHAAVTFIRALRETRP